MEYEHMNLENINSPDYETVIDDDYETPVGNNPQLEDRNPQVTVNLPIAKANEKVCEIINKCDTNQVSFYNVIFPIELLVFKSKH